MKKQKYRMDAVFIFKNKSLILKKYYFGRLSRVFQRKKIRNIKYYAINYIENNNPQSNSTLNLKNKLGTKLMVIIHKGYVCLAFTKHPKLFTKKRMEVYIDLFTK